MDAWLNSAERKRLLEEATSFDEETHVRKVQSGFESWFVNPEPSDQAKPAAWKMNSIVLLVLYPTVFLWGFFVGTPILTRLGVPFYWSLFIGNIFSVAATGWLLIPKGSQLLSWWVFPDKDAPRTTVWYGALIVLVGYALSLYIFSRFPPALGH
jgi:antibiotic biosynthesis monooxygenase (ABM) superfamily enzyme